MRGAPYPRAHSGICEVMVLTLRRIFFLLAVVLLAVVFLSSCSESATPQTQLATAIDTTRTPQEKLEAVAQFIENTLISHYNTIKDEYPHSDWTSHAPEAMKEVIDDLTRAGFTATDAGRAYRVYSTIYVHEHELLTTWIDVKRNKARIVVAGCDESDSRQLIGRQLALATQDSRETGPIRVVHRSRIERRLPDDWVRCTTRESP